MATKSVNAAEIESVPKAVVTYDEKADLRKYGVTDVPAND